jgi:DNA-binding transcriptional ArsR family regulator
MTDSQHDVFDAISDSTRRLMIEKLSTEGDKTATEFASELPITRQGVTKHLAILAEAGLVTTRKQGRDRLYSLTPQALQNAVSWVGVVNEAWDRRLGALRDFLLSEQDDETEDG